jgi:hypothetical protein
MKNFPGKSENALIVVSMLCVYRLPSSCKALVKSDLFPYLKALLAPKGSTFDQPMNTSMAEAVSIPGVVEPETCSSEGSVNYKNYEANVCSKCTSASRSNSLAMLTGGSMVSSNKGTCCTCH